MNLNNISQTCYDKLGSAVDIWKIEAELTINSIPKIITWYGVNIADQKTP